MVWAGNAVTQNDAQRQRCTPVRAMVFERMNLARGIAPQHNFVAQTAQRNRVVLHKSRGTDRKPQVFQTDFQGGIDHVGPKYGPRGCAPAPEGASPFDVGGLVHTGLVEPMFQALSAQGADLSPLQASAERFLQIWEEARAARGPLGGGG